MDWEFPAHQLSHSEGMTARLGWLHSPTPGRAGSWQRSQVRRPFLSGSLLACRTATGFRTTTDPTVQGTSRYLRSWWFERIAIPNPQLGVGHLCSDRGIGV